jgi:cytochrome c
VALLLAPSSASAQAVDNDSAIALAKSGDCFKCHAIDKAKKAPSYIRIAQKYAGNPNAESIIEQHLKGNPMVKLEDGDEPHKAPPAKSDAELRNLIRWILSRG